MLEQNGKPENSSSLTEYGKEDLENDEECNDFFTSVFTKIMVKSQITLTMKLETVQRLHVLSLKFGTN